MGDLVVGRPTLRQLFAVSAPLALTSAISLALRAGVPSPEGAQPGFDHWIIDARRALDQAVRHDLDLLLGFSGRLINYAEELLFSFDALAPERLDAAFEDYFTHLSALPPERFQEMAGTAVVRVYRARGVTEAPPETDDPAEWRMFLRPGITRADLDEAVALVTSPGQLKGRTLALLDSFWTQCFGAEYDRRLPELQRAVRFARAHQHPVVEVTFSELTGRQLPGEIAAALSDVRRVTFCPSPYLGDFVQYILYQPELILYFNPPDEAQADWSEPRFAGRRAEALPDADVLDGFKALADPSRMKIVAMLKDGEMYAQEIVARLGISQSAVSRHLGTLESAGVVAVRPATGMKYYSVDRARLRALAGHLDALADHATSD